MNLTRDDEVKVTIANRWGSVEHYYHFLLGFCVPLVRYFLHDLRQDDRVRLVVRECGPLTRILTELPLNLLILPKAEFARTDKDRRAVELRGFDHYRRFSHQVFAEFRGFIQRNSRPTSAKNARIPVLLIEREAPDPYYALPQAETPGGGTGRRTILNHEELMSHLKAMYPGLQNHRLANLSIYEQCQLFSSADAVIAQHGAALSNIIFMKENSMVFEIGGMAPSVKIFKNLARIMKLRYGHFPERNPFPTLNIGVISKAIAAMLPNYAASHHASGALCVPDEGPRPLRQ